MLEVCAALLPGMFVLIWLHGPAVLTQVLLASTTAYGAEWCALRLRGRPPWPPPGDASTLVTALLLALCLAPTTPWYVTVSGTAFAIGIAKHCFGGLGQNLFNPAMAGYVFALLCFPGELLYRLPPGAFPDGAFPDLGSALLIPFTLGAEARVDAVSGATSLAFVQAGLRSQETIPELRATLAQLEQGQLLLALAWLLGGAWLLARRIIHWRIPLSILAALALAATLAWLLDDQRYPSAWFHCLQGSTLLATFFIATDPVSSATTPRGQLLYGIGIGVLTWYAHNWGPYADGIAFAILAMNACVPLLDSLHRPVPGAKR